MEFCKIFKKTYCPVCCLGLEYGQHDLHTNVGETSGQRGLFGRVQGPHIFRSRR